MKHPKEFYRTYIADDTFVGMNAHLLHLIMNCKPVHAFEFGCGTGKILAHLRNFKIVACGLDISFVNTQKAILKNDNDFIIYGDETHLRHLCNFDVVFTCSVLDHVKEEDFKPILNELKRIANKNVIICETNDTPADYYYRHDYEAEGFVKVTEKPLKGQDGANYYIWIWDKLTTVTEVCAE